MSRLIDADALITDCQLAQKQADRHGREFASAFYSDGGEISTEWWCVEDMIENAPTIEPRKGKWIPHKEKCREYIGTVLAHVEYDYWLCDACGYRVKKGQPMYNFCPNCGADMRGWQDD